MGQVFRSDTSELTNHGSHIPLSCAFVKTLDTSFYIRLGECRTYSATVILNKLFPTSFQIGTLYTELKDNMFQVVRLSSEIHVSIGQQPYQEAP